ncbi:unnamed protein product [Peniophora sp. CBMAI 1063]|nr:unnamed protein product [Peniophora sp. CBMAI 1063]
MLVLCAYIHVILIPTEAFIFDLQRVFPAVEPSSDTVSVANAWRTRALEMESRLGDVQTLADSERTELIALRLAVSSSETQETSSKPSKKTKANSHPNVAPMVPSLSSVSWTPALRAMLALAQSDVSRPPIQVFIDTFTRMVESLYEKLTNLLSFTSPNHPSRSQSSETLSLIGVILPQLLSSALSSIIHAHKSDGSPRAEDISSYSAPTAILRHQPMYSVADAVDALLQPVQTHIIGPILSSMRNLSRMRTERLLKSKTEVSRLPAAPLHPAALLPTLNALLHALANAEATSKGGTRRAQVVLERIHAMKDCAALCASRELLSLLDRALGDDVRSPAARVARLARKEALHTLCTALSLFLEPPPGHLNDGFLRERLGTVLSDLALRHLSLNVKDKTGRNTARLSAVEQDALLSILERAWACEIRWDGEGHEDDYTMG